MFAIRHTDYHALNTEPKRPKICQFLRYGKFKAVHRIEPRLSHPVARPVHGPRGHEVLGHAGYGRIGRRDVEHGHAPVLLPHFTNKLKYAFDARGGVLRHSTP